MKSGLVVELESFWKGLPRTIFCCVVSNLVVNYAKCPLALEVLGSFLRGKGRSEWKSALDKLGTVCSVDILKTPEISYDGLNDDEKKIFLHIACFFNGKDKDEVMAACDVSDVIGIEVLIERSLLTILNGRVHMHDALQEMDRKIVIRESPIEPGRRSRLWLREDANRVLSKNTGTEAIEGIVLHPTEPGLKVHANSKSFSTMKNLGFLGIDNLILPNGHEHLPDSLQILKWTGYPATSLPSSFNPGKILELSMCPSCIYHFLTGIKLNKMPEELGLVECLEELHMSGTAIRDLPSSIGMLEGLTSLD
ncbi:putative disease resistance protein At4g11170 [Argentina anserina]|uniref:putative disease resistance protein At4g11170 n=1 Tax=Argentina anserina TaxID=57926 RepID=UPI00217637E3|nr:putative disease resistance protein At4g11170 [Potentilla anserina]